MKIRIRIPGKKGPLSKASGDGSRRTGTIAWYDLDTAIDEKRISYVTRRNGPSETGR